MVAPFGPNAKGPNLTVTGDGAILAWVEHGTSGNTLAYAQLTTDGRWGPREQVPTDPSLLANDADTPTVAALSGGGVAAIWTIGRERDGSIALDVMTARKPDVQAPWGPAATLTVPGAAGESGFGALVPSAAGPLAFWLDGRDSEGSGTQLRVASLGALPPTNGSATAPSEVVIPRVCDCCRIAVATGSQGPVVAYRGRSAKDVRDIAVMRWNHGAPPAPVTVHGDGWVLHGCPVNGPALAADGDTVAVAWYTEGTSDGIGGAGGKVLLALSKDGGGTFAAPVVLDAETPRGRVGVALASGHAIAIWLAKGQVLMSQRVDLDGHAEAPKQLAAKAYGYPKVAIARGRLLITYLGVDEGPAVAVMAL
jgi:hypothetical protein